MTIFLGLLAAVYTVSLVFVIGLFARTLWREHAHPLEQGGTMQLTATEQPDMPAATKTA